MTKNSDVGNTSEQFDLSRYARKKAKYSVVGSEANINNIQHLAGVIQQPIYFALATNKKIPTGKGNKSLRGDDGLDLNNLFPTQTALDALNNDKPYLWLASHTLPSDWMVIDLDDKSGKHGGELWPDIAKALDGAFIERSKSGLGFHFIVKLGDDLMQRFSHKLAFNQRKKFTFRDLGGEFDCQVKKVSWMCLTGQAYPDNSDWLSLDGVPTNREAFISFLNELEILKPEQKSHKSGDKNIEAQAVALLGEGLTDAKILANRLRPGKLKGDGSGMAKLMDGEEAFIDEHYHGDWSSAESALLNKATYFSRDFDTLLAMWGDTKLSQRLAPAYKGTQPKKFDRDDYVESTIHDALKNRMNSQMIYVSKDYEEILINLSKHDPIMSVQKTYEQHSPWNTQLLIEHCGKYHGIFGFNVLTLSEEVRKNPLGNNWTLGGIEKRHLHSVRTHLEQMQYKTSLQVIEGAIANIVEKNHFNPIADALNALQWDGVERLATVAADYFGTDTIEDNSPFAQIAIRKTLIAAVAKGLDPCNEVDTVLILNGAQELGKSRGIKLLCQAVYPKGYATLSRKIADSSTQNQKAIAEIICGKWLVEFDEMTATASRTQEEQNRVKGFVTNDYDSGRQAYMRTSQDYVRSCIFIGTHNPEFGSGVINDPTGARRWWPIEVGKIDLEGIKSDAPQLWAEAVYLYKSGESWRLTAEEKALQEQAVHENSTENTLDPFLHKVLWSAMQKHSLKKDIETPFNKIHVTTDGERWIGGFSAMDLWQHIQSDCALLTELKGLDQNADFTRLKGRINSGFKSIQNCRQHKKKTPQGQVRLWWVKEDSAPI